jgi:muramoyltetrapeptide carboxypeptidase
MLHQLERAGMTDGVRGLAFGRFNDAPDEDEHPVEDALREFAERLRVPAVSDLPFGHVAHNCTLPVGVRARLSGDEGSLEILEPAVAKG